MNIVLAAQEMAGLHVLKELARSGHRVVAVLTEPPRSSQEERSSLWNVANDLGLKTLPAQMVKDPAPLRWFEFRKLGHLAWRKRARRHHS